MNNENYIMEFNNIVFPSNRRVVCIDIFVKNTRETNIIQRFSILLKYATIFRKSFGEIRERVRQTIPALDRFFSNVEHLFYISFFFSSCFSTLNRACALFSFNVIRSVTGKEFFNFDQEVFSCKI